MISIWKYSLSLEKRISELDLPIGAEILSVQNQNECLCLWAKVNTDRKTKTIKVEVVETGNPIDVGTERRFLGTVQFDGGSYVVHFFERI